MVDTRSAAATVPGGLEAAALRGLGSTSFSSRLLAHDRRPTELELRNGMTLASWRAARGTAGWEWGVGDQRGGARLRAGNVLRPEDDSVTIAGV